MHCASIARDQNLRWLCMISRIQVSSGMKTISAVWACIFRSIRFYCHCWLRTDLVICWFVAIVRTRCWRRWRKLVPSVWLAWAFVRVKLSVTGSSSLQLNSINPFKCTILKTFTVWRFCRWSRTQIDSLNTRVWIKQGNTGFVSFYFIESKTDQRRIPLKALFSRSLIPLEASCVIRCVGAMLTFLNLSPNLTKSLNFQLLNVTTVLTVENSFLQYLRILPNKSDTFEGKDLPFLVPV